MKNFSRKAIFIQVLCGILFSIVANPYLIYNYVYQSELIVILQILFLSFICINAILKGSREDYKKALSIDYFRPSRNYFTVFLFTTVEVTFLVYVYVHFLMKKEYNIYRHLLLPVTIAFIVIQLVSYLIRKRRYYLQA